MLPKMFERTAPKGLESSLNRTRNSSTVNKTEPLKCDCCGSYDIAENHENLICTSCGVVLEVQKLEYYRPYSETVLQNSIQLGTQVGNQNDRRKFSNHFNLNRLNKIHSSKTSEEQAFTTARVEISRIFTAMGLPKSKKEVVFTTYKKVRNIMQPGSKYRSPERLVPLVIYFQLKLEGLSFSVPALLDIINESKQDFKYGLLTIGKFIPKYAERNRKNYILQRIMCLKEELKFDMLFYRRSKKVLERLWNLIKGTKDDIIVGVAVSVVFLCWYHRKKGYLHLSTNSICDLLGIKMCTIQVQVQKNIFEKLNKEGFSTLVRSSGLLKGIVKELLVPAKKNVVAPSQAVSVSTSDVELPASVPMASTVLEVELNNLLSDSRLQDFEIQASKVSPDSPASSRGAFKNREVYLYSFLSNSGEPLIISLRVPLAKHRRRSLFRRRIRERYSNEVGVECSKAYTVSGPPF